MAAHDLKFVDAHSIEWSDIALGMTREYFLWMNEEIVKACQFSIPDMVGMALDDYIQVALNNVCPRDQINSKYYLLTSGDTAMAMGGLRTLHNGDAEVVRIYTRPAYRGRGIASMMIKRLISDARHSGFTTLKLDTGIFMKDAQEVYVSYGFKECQPYEGAEPPSRLLPFWIFMELDLSQG